MSDDNEFGEVTEITEDELGGDINQVMEDEDADVLEDGLEGELSEDEYQDEEDPYAEIEEILDPNDTDPWDDR